MVAEAEDHIDAHRSRYSAIRDDEIRVAVPAVVAAAVVATVLMSTPKEFPTKLRRSGVADGASKRRAVLREDHVRPDRCL